MGDQFNECSCDVPVVSGVTAVGDATCSGPSVSADDVHKWWAMYKRWASDIEEMRKEIEFRKRGSQLVEAQARMLAQEVERLEQENAELRKRLSEADAFCSCLSAKILDMQRPAF